MERGCALGVGHRRRQLRDLPQSHYGSLHRVPGQPVFSHFRRVQRRLGRVQPRFPLSLHFTVAQGKNLAFATCIQKQACGQVYLYRVVLRQLGGKG